MTNERREYPRLKIHIPIEIVPDDSGAPLRGETCDISLGGCYVETIFPFQVGTAVEVRMRVGQATVIALAVIATCDPQVGNGIQFVTMLPDDFGELKAFIQAAEETDNQHGELVTVGLLDREHGPCQLRLSM